MNMITHSQNFHLIIRQFSKYVPQHEPISKMDLRNFKKFLDNFDKILVLTGAGISTESGIPDYRSQMIQYKPIMYSEFLKNEEVRKRYWARNFVGWSRFSNLAPNRNHYFINNLQLMGKTSGIITQNVDGLHSKAGSINIVELHGNAFWVHCVKCKDLFERDGFQKALREANPNWSVTADEIKPDGDVSIKPEHSKDFVVPKCKNCGGILKPMIVFYGSNIPLKRVEKVENMVKECDSILVAGTSLTTLSSFRIVTQAYDLNKFVCIVNIGKTRGDKYADLIINGKCSDVFPIIEISC